MRFSSSIAIGLVLVGCSLARTPLGIGSDAGGPGLDAPLPDVLGVDAPDTGMPDVPIDVGETCEDVGDRCLGDVIVRCVDGVPSTEDCNDAGAYCELGACVPRVCIPNAVTCDGTMETRCDARGAASTTANCARGCIAGTGCAPETACSLAVQGVVEVGMTYRIDTCGAGDDSVFNAGCTRVERSGPDVIARLNVATAGRFRVTLNRVRSGTDPVLYIRTACADGASQLACNDDDSGFNSRIDIDLMPGDYFLMLDTFRDDDESLEERCGQMDIRVDRL